MTCLTVSDVARRLVCSEKTVRRMIADGDLRAINLKPNSSRGLWRVPEVSLSALLRGNMTAEDNHNA